jgi:hypothetical protein
MAQGDAAGVNGSNRILFHSAPPFRMMPNGCLGSPVLVLLFGLERGFLMDVRPKCATKMVLLAVVAATQAPQRARRVPTMMRVSPLFPKRLTLLLFEAGGWSQGLGIAAAGAARVRVYPWMVRSDIGLLFPKSLFACYVWRL